MAKTKTSSKVKRKYNAKAYDQIQLLVKHGMKDIIKNYASHRGQSVNSYLNSLIAADMAANPIPDTSTAETSGAQNPPGLLDNGPAANNDDTNTSQTKALND